MSPSARTIRQFFLEPGSLLEEDPLDLPGHLSVLAEELSRRGTAASPRLSLVEACLQHGYLDPSSLPPEGLLGASRARLLAHLERPSARPEATRWLEARARPAECLGSDPAVAILSHGNEEETRRAVESARMAGLEVHVGLTAGQLSSSLGEGAKVHRVEWHEDFARARNELLELIDADYVLWMDSDEWLVLSPAQGCWRLRDPVMTVLFHFKSEWTPLPTRRLHRRGEAFWSGRIHEWMVDAEGLEFPAAVPACPVVIGHDGYDGEERRDRKIDRNHRLALPGLDSVSPSLGDLLALAQYEMGPDRFNSLTWLRLFRRSLEPPARLHLAGVAAKVLCASGFTTPARHLLRLAPAMVSLRMACLAAGLRCGRPPREEDLEQVCSLLASGRFAPEDPVPVRLLGASREACLQYTRELAANWPRPDPAERPTGLHEQLTQAGQRGVRAAASAGPEAKDRAEAGKALAPASLSPCRAGDRDVRVHSFRWRDWEVWVEGTEDAFFARVAHLLDLTVVSAPGASGRDGRIVVDSSADCPGVASAGKWLRVGSRRELTLLLASILCDRFLRMCTAPLLHAGGLCAKGEAILFCGPDRCGKSSLTYAAWRRGHEVMGDDRMLIDPARGCVSATPRLISLRVPGAAEAAAAVERAGLCGDDYELALLGGELRLALGRRLPRMVPLDASLPVRQVLVVERSVTTQLVPLSRQEALHTFVQQALCVAASPLKVLRLLEPLRASGRVQKLQVGTGEIDRALSLVETLLD